MATDYHLRLYWPGRADPPDLLARQAGAFITSLAAADPAARAWRAELEGGVVAVDSPATVQRVVAEGEVRWRMGRTERTAYDLRFFLGDARRRSATLAITCGIPALEVAGVYAPNRLTLTLGGAAHDATVARSVLEAALAAGVEAYRPAWGHVGHGALPAASEPIFSDPTPVVGWLTYLSGVYPDVPRDLPAPAVVRALGGDGVVVVAHPDLVQDGNRAHREAIARVGAALARAGVLHGGDRGTSPVPEGGPPA